jgi:N-acyl-L-homoserine lactone synthetase
MRVISGASSRLPEGLYPRLAHYRYQVFIERLGWQLPTQEQAESDQFDGPDAVYVVAEEPDGEISGCARLLPTDGPYPLSALFPELLNGLPPPRDPTIWELSRFTAVHLSRRSRSPLADFPNSAAALLMREAMACASAHGARRLITVTALAMERLIRRLGIHSHRMGPPRIVGGEPIYGCWIEL